jgi:hypothetical protein
LRYFSYIEKVPYDSAKIGRSRKGILGSFIIEINPKNSIRLMGHSNFIFTLSKKVFYLKKLCKASLGEGGDMEKLLYEMEQS